MTSISTQAIVLSVCDNKDNDRLANIFSLEYGKLKAVFKGVKKQGAKLKAAAMPFCYAGFELVKSSGDMYIVTGCEVFETFFDLASDYDRYESAAGVLKICEEILKPAAPSPILFATLLRSFSAYLRKDQCEAVKLKFLLECFKSEGRELSFSGSCISCGQNIRGSKSLDLDLGGAVCLSCAGRNSYAMSDHDYNIFRIVSDTPFERLRLLKLDEGASASAVFLERVLMNT